MWGAIIGAAMALGSAAIGAVESSSAARKIRGANEKARIENKNWYDRKMAEDYTLRSDNQAVIKRQRELLDESYRKAKAMNVVAGGSEESLNAQKELANQSLSNTMTDMAARSVQEKDAAEDKYLARKAEIETAQRNAEVVKSQQIAQAAGQGVQAGIGMMASGIGETIAAPNAGASVTNPLATEASRQSLATAQSNLDNTLRSGVVNTKPTKIVMWYGEED